MITPRFSCTQTEQSVIVSVYCPSVRASDVEINVDQTLFTLHINPYFLRLNFPHHLQEDEEQTSARYDASSGHLTVTLTKTVPGEDFKDLDLLAKLLAPRPPDRQDTGPLIEVLSTEDSHTETEDELSEKTAALSLSHEQEEILKAAENDWQIEQEVPTHPIKLSNQQRYGFLDMYSGYFKHVEHTENEINELGGDAETCDAAERRKRRMEHEDSKWDEEYYMADFVDDEYIQELIRWKHPNVGAADIQFSEAENLAMLRLPRKEYIASSGQTHNLYLALLSVLYAYAYDSRTTQRDPTSESSWTICNLTPLFSALDPPPYGLTPPHHTLSTYIAEELSSTFSASYRRTLAFPLYRSFALAEKCRADVAGFLAGGKRLVLRCLLELKDILDHHDVYYVYSKIWVEDLCVWVSSKASDEVLSTLASAVSDLKMRKDMIGWGLEELEALTLEEDAERAADSDDESEDEVERMLPAPL